MFVHPSIIKQDNNYEYVPVKIRFQSWKRIFDKKRGSRPGEQSSCNELGEGSTSSGFDLVSATDRQQLLDELYPRAENCECLCSCVMHCECFDNLDDDDCSVMTLSSSLQLVGKVELDSALEENLLEDSMFDAKTEIARALESPCSSGDHVSPAPQPGCSSWSNDAWKGDDEIIGDVCILPEGVNADDYDGFPSHDNHDVLSIFSDVSSDYFDSDDDEIYHFEKDSSYSDVVSSSGKNVKDGESSSAIADKCGKSIQQIAPKAGDKTTIVYPASSVSEADSHLSTISSQLPNNTNDVTSKNYDSTRIQTESKTSAPFTAKDLIESGIDLNHSFDDRVLIEKSIDCLTMHTFELARHQFKILGGTGYLKKEMEILRKSCSAIKTCIVNQNFVKNTSKKSRKRKTTQNLDLFSYDYINSSGDGISAKKKSDINNCKVVDLSVKNKKVSAKISATNDGKIENINEKEIISQNNIIIKQGEEIISEKCASVVGINLQKEECEKAFKEISQESLINEGKIIVSISKGEIDSPEKDLMPNSDDTLVEKDNNIHMNDIEGNITLCDEIIDLCLAELLNSIVSEEITLAKQETDNHQIDSDSINEVKEYAKESTNNKKETCDKVSSMNEEIDIKVISEDMKLATDEKKKCEKKTENAEEKNVEGNISSVTIENLPNKMVEPVDKFEIAGKFSEVAPEKVLPYIKVYSTPVCINEVIIATPILPTSVEQPQTSKFDHSQH